MSYQYWLSVYCFHCPHSKKLEELKQKSRELDELERLLQKYAPNLYDFLFKK